MGFTKRPMFRSLSETPNALKAFSSGLTPTETSPRSARGRRPGRRGPGLTDGLHSERRRLAAGLGGEAARRAHFHAGRPTAAP